MNVDFSNKLCACGLTPRLVEPQTIDGKGHPAKGLVIAPAYVYCKCGRRSASCKSSKEAVNDWNAMVFFDPHNVKDPSFRII